MVDRPRLTYFQGKLREAKSNQEGSIVIIVIGVFLVGLSFFLPQHAREYVGPAPLLTGLVIGMVGALELSYHTKEYNGYRDLIEQSKTRDFNLSRRETSRKLDEDPINQDFNITFLV